MIVYVVEYCPQWSETWDIFGIFMTKDGAESFMADEEAVKTVFDKKGFLIFKYQAVREEMFITEYTVDDPFA